MNIRARLTYIINRCLGKTSKPINGTMSSLFDDYPLELPMQCHWAYLIGSLVLKKCDGKVSLTDTELANACCDLEVWFETLETGGLIITAKEKPVNVHN